MSGITTNFELPYMEDTDPLAAVADFIEALADAVDLALPKVTRKLLDENVNNSTALQNDDHLFFAVEAGNVYQFEFGLMFTTGSSAIDAKVALTHPGGTLTWGIVGLISTAGAGSHGELQADAFVAAASGTSAAIGVSAGSSHATIRGTYVCTTTGTLRLQWAQNTLTAANMTLSAGSYVKRQIVP